MKPIILTERENGEIKITKEQLLQIIDEAYNEGKRDATPEPTISPSRDCLNGLYI